MEAEYQLCQLRPSIDVEKNERFAGHCMRPLLCPANLLSRLARPSECTGRKSNFYPLSFFLQIYGHFSIFSRSTLVRIFSSFLASSLSRPRRVRNIRLYSGEGVPDQENSTWCSYIHSYRAVKPLNFLDDEHERKEKFLCLSSKRRKGRIFHQAKNNRPSRVKTILNECNFLGPYIFQGITSKPWMSPARSKWLHSGYPGGYYTIRCEKEEKYRLFSKNIFFSKTFPLIMHCTGSFLSPCRMIGQG